ncbi:hypothetical protein [Neopusillimonas maritima]|jgi:ornithine cyclodeaminase/alanine dehydrogenase-like protein (mu-crystallin family)|uniref:Ornithine cyclodeaminase n=1 Tax=Neopusillimonas maritima TaxID=2026239 RepID=A0ABX9MT28_9BURK|nr:hypothetical protein [Neopusillimonas maritima]RII82023.1 hypothetical protein CJO09_13555 [Neopusillimonas maritima]
MTIRLLSVEDVRESSPSITDIVKIIRRTYEEEGRGRVDVPLKIGVRPDRPGTFLDAMPAWVGDDEAGMAGLKWVSYYPGSAFMHAGKTDSSGLIVLNDPQHGQPVCLMEGMLVTYLRTTICAAVMAQVIQTRGRDPISLGLVGCGGLGRWSLRVFGEVFPSLKHVKVASRSAASRQAFCEEMAREGTWSLDAVDDVRDAVADCDVVISSLPPVVSKPIEAQWLAPDAIYVPLDLTHAWQTDVWSKAGTVVADSPAFLRKLLAAHRPDVSVDAHQVLAIQDLVAQGDGKLSNALKGPFFAAVCGIASTDIALAWAVFRNAQLKKLGSGFDMKASDVALHSALVGGYTNAGLRQGVKA